ncbi:ribonuclease M5 [Facklamia miroungae]|uniref:Ribonuclease M5 n=1 Tax=Facklamia miroungae TaxID=120956 RepID=A0A1G7RRJ1_9LACT|nr:ribonuclease M5 [Facklamia miroungae]NKZ29323.1 ribonuclease M5 [Facklamia miroungae]SDG12799.1 ribonuclease M5 [Facklamia miroungae]
MREIEVPKEVVVVEGKSDTQRLNQIFGSAIKTIETNGSAIDSAIIKRIKDADERFGVIVFTDPDYPGERIRRIIRAEVPSVKEAFLSQEAANSHRKKDSLGIEHASAEAIQTALKKVTQMSFQAELKPIPMSELVALGLAGSDQAKLLRQKLADHFNLGHVNAKQLQKQMAKYQVTREEVIQVLEGGKANDQELK